MCMQYLSAVFFFFQAEDGIRDLVRSRGLGDVYKRQPLGLLLSVTFERKIATGRAGVLTEASRSPA